MNPRILVTIPFLAAGPLSKAATPIPSNDWVRVPAGNYVMGSPATELGRDEKEAQTLIVFTYDYWILNHETTRAEWEAISHHGSNFVDHGRVIHTNTSELIPLSNIFYSNQVAGCDEIVEWCAAKTTNMRTAGFIDANWEIRLPYSCEWERACRAGSTNAHFWGASWTNWQTYAWLGSNTDNNLQIGMQLASNNWGLFDMVGNITELCGDWTGTHPGAVLVNWTGHVGGFDDARVGRGSNYQKGDGGDDGYPSNITRSAYWAADPFNYQQYTWGFRPVIAPVAAPTLWYVDAAATGGNDGTSWTDAWTHPTNVVWASVGSGDVVFLSGGSASQTYTNSATNIMRVTAAGISGEPIRIMVGQESGHNGFAIFDGEQPWPGPKNGTNQHMRIPHLLDLAGRDWITIDGSVSNESRLWFQHSYNSRTNQDGHDNKLDGAAIYGLNSDFIDVRWITATNVSQGVYVTSSTNTTVMWCTLVARGDAVIKMNDPRDYPPGTWGVFPIVSNHLTSMCRTNMTMPGDEEPTPTWGRGPDGLHSRSGLDCHGNVFDVMWCDFWTSGQHPDLIQGASSGVPGSQVRIHGNEFINLGESSIDYDASASGVYPHRDIYIYNNVFRLQNCQQTARAFIRFYDSAEVVDGYSNVLVLNNLFADQYYAGGSGITFEEDDNEWVGSGNTIANNIFVNVGENTSPTPCWRVRGSNSTSAWVVTNNIIYHTNQAIQYVSWRDTNYLLTAWIANFDPNVPTNIPAFTSYEFDSADNDFHLQSSDTVAISNGLSYATIFTSDKDGNERGAVWDIGPYEYSPAEEEPEPPAGTNTLQKVTLRGAKVTLRNATLR